LAAIDSQLVVTFLSNISHCHLCVPTQDGALSKCFDYVETANAYAIALPIQPVDCSLAAKFSLLFNPAVGIFFTVAVLLGQQPMLTLMPHNCSATAFLW